MVDAPAVSQLASHLGYRLRYVSNHVSHAFARKLEAKGVTVAEWAVLRELYGEDGVAPSRLAQGLGLTRGAISKLSDRLVAKDLLVREGNPDDGRARSLSLSRAGRRLVPKLSALADQNDAEFFADVSEEDRSTVERILNSILQRRGLKSMAVS